MDWERVLINFGVVAGFFVLMSFWIGVAMWLRIDADKRGMVGWAWAFVGLLTGPLGLIAYIFYRGNRPELPVVRKRDELINETARAHAPMDYDPDAPAPPVIAPSTTPPVDSIQAALDAENRTFSRGTRDEG